MTHSEGFFPPEYAAPLPVPDGSDTKIDGVAKNYAPPAVPPALTASINGVPMSATHDDPPAVPPAFTHAVDGVPKNFTPLPEPPAFTGAVDGVPFENSRDGHDQPLPDPDGGSWTLTASLVLLLGLLGFLGSCRALAPRYRPGPSQELPVVHVDPRPDLPGVPIVEGHPLYRCLEFLRAVAPTARTVTVRSSPVGDPFLGWTCNDPQDPNALVIEVRDDLEGYQQRDVLVHEYAHALAWDVRESPHGAVWGAFYSYLWRATRGEL